MVSTQVADLRAMTDEVLLNELEESQRALFNVRFQAATRQLADVSQVRGARRRIARVKTLLRERAILAEYGALLGAAAPADTADAEPADAAAAPGEADEGGADTADDDEAGAADDAADDGTTEEDTERE